MDCSSADIVSPATGETAAACPPPSPLFVYLDGARVVVVGAGDVAERKIATLLEYGADVIVVAPEATPQVEQWAADGAIAFERRSYAHGDLEGALLVIGATNVRSVNEAVYAEASERSMLVNIVDVPDLCNTIIPSVLRRGNLQIAVSTAGSAPSVARDIRRSLEEQYSQAWEGYIDLLGEVRGLIKQRITGPASARMPIYEMLGSSDLLERLEAGERLGAEEVYDGYVVPFCEGRQQ